MTHTDPTSQPPLGVAVRAVVRRHDGRFLLLRRARNVATDAGKWELPGGKLDFGETAQEALAREVQEETGLTVTVGRPIHVTNLAKDPYWVTSVTFVCDYDGGDIRLSDENDDFVWIESSEVPDRTYGHTMRTRLDAYASLVTGTELPR